MKYMNEICTDDYAIKPKKLKIWVHIKNSSHI